MGRQEPDEDLDQDMDGLDELRQDEPEEMVRTSAILQERLGRTDEVWPRLFNMLRTSALSTIN